MSTYESALTEAHTLLGDPKALKGSTQACIFRTPAPREEYFSVRASRADALRAEGFIEIARVNQDGSVTLITQP